MMQKELKAWIYLNRKDNNKTKCFTNYIINAMN